MAIPDRTSELDRFKSDIDLCQFACNWAGYIKDVKSSSRSSAVLRHENGDKIIVARMSNGHYVFFSVHDAADQGSIIDFVQHRERLNIGQVRQLLRRFADGKGPYGSMPSSIPSLVPSTFDISSVLRSWNAARPLLPMQNYLEIDRCISGQVLCDTKFDDLIRCDSRGNVLFLHCNEDGITGFEMKNRNWTGFSPGGLKGLWVSHRNSQTREIAVFESAIDALSLACLEDHTNRQFVSTSGRLSPAQRNHLVQLAQQVFCERVLLCFDNDDGGDAIMADIRQAIPSDIEVVEHRPQIRGCDWNDVLKNAFATKQKY